MNPPTCVTCRAWDHDNQSRNAHRCGAHFPVGEDGEFVWTADGQRVGT